MFWLGSTSTRGPWQTNACQCLRCTEDLQLGTMDNGQWTVEDACQGEEDCRKGMVERKEGRGQRSSMFSIFFALTCLEP